MLKDSPFLTANCHSLTDISNQSFVLELVVLTSMYSFRFSSSQTSISYGSPVSLPSFTHFTTLLPLFL
ncbi:hypothetical protein Hanom_Chr02g00146531 [Helianthus anomalus]